MANRRHIQIHSSAFKSVHIHSDPFQLQFNFKSTTGSNGRPGQIAAAESIARERQQEEDGARRESVQTGGSSSSGGEAAGTEDAEENSEPRDLDEVEEHRATGHAEYKPWCSACVGGRGRERMHRRTREQGKLQEDENVVCRVCMDFATLTKPKRTTRDLNRDTIDEEEESLEEDD